MKCRGEYLNMTMLIMIIYVYYIVIYMYVAFAEHTCRFNVLNILNFEGQRKLDRHLKTVSG